MEYKIEKCALFDMFPRTAHFECVALFTANEQHPEGNDYSGCGYGGLSQD